MATPDAFLAPLEPTMADLLEAHLTASKEWFPHDLVPWSRGRDFEPGWTWSEGDSELSPAVRSALFVNLLTEDNLPHYFRALDRIFGRESAWGEWSRRWTAEEGRHSIVIRDYLTVTRAVDPVELERARMIQVSMGAIPEVATPADAIAYVTLQELATRISHLNTGRLIEDPAGYEIMKRVASDENRHHLVYRSLVSAALETDPSEMVLAIERQVRGFAMPGTGIPGFTEHARRIAKAGIYSFAIHHDQILVPVVIHQWGIDRLEGLTPEAEAAREQLLKRIERIGVVARRQERELALS